MNFPVPWRCLLPSETVDFLSYNDHAILRDLSDSTGAMLDISGTRDTPKRLSDKIVTISGLAEQKEKALRVIVDKLRRLQDLADPSWIGYFVIIVPASAVPVVVGAKGASIQEVLATSGIELSIGKENVMGMPDTPIGLEGTAAQVVCAVAGIHGIIQDMADRGRLMPSDFKYRPEKAAAALAGGAGMAMPEVQLPPLDHDTFHGMDPTQNFRTKAKIIVDTSVAGWLIGRQGRHIREMQENSGAFLHLLREEESPAILRPGDRLIEICGRYERKLEGIAVVLHTANQLPGDQPPKETLMLVHKKVALPNVVQDVGSRYGCTVESWEDPSHEEAVVTMTGSITSRVLATQAFMALLDQAHIDGVVVALAPDGTVVGAHGRPREEMRDRAPGGVQSAIPDWRERPALGPRMPVKGVPSVCPISGNRSAMETVRSGTQRQAPSAASISYQEKSDRAKDDPPEQPPEEPAMGPHSQRVNSLTGQRGDPGETMRKPAPAPFVSRPHQAAEPVPLAQARSLPVQQHRQEAPPVQQHRQEAPPVQQHRQEAPPVQLDRPNPSPAGGPMDDAPPPAANLAERPAYRPIQSAPQQSRPGPADMPGPSDDTCACAGALADKSALRHIQTAPAAQRALSQVPEEALRDEFPLGAHTSEIPAAPIPPEEPYEPPHVPEGSAGAARLTGERADLAMIDGDAEDGVHSKCGFSAFAHPGCMELGCFGIEGVLASHSQCGHMQMQFQLLIPEAPLRQALIPNGYLQEVAQRCQVRVDLAPELLQQSQLRIVTLTGTSVANAAAGFYLQDGLARLSNAVA